MSTGELKTRTDSPVLARPPRCRRALGAYYTPSDIAVTLTQWALRDNIGPVLDPSYGICRFLDAAVDVLTGLKAPHPELAVYGIDVDEEATVKTTTALRARGARESQFLHRDFFTCPPEARYATVLGNPPYVRRHWQNQACRTSVLSALTDAGVTLSRRASLWAPFVVHADRFVRDGGRLAMLLPGAAIQAQYAEPVWGRLASRYRSVTLVRVGERAFRDALEETVVLLADGRTRESSRRKPLVAELPAFADLQAALADDPLLVHLRNRACPTRSVRRTLTATRLLAIAAEHEATKTLGDVATVRIGTVTGANALFLRRPSDPLLTGLHEHEVAAAVPRSGALAGARWTTADDDAAVEAGDRCRLMRLDPNLVPGGRHRDVLEEARNAGVHERSHCRRRDPWWAIPPHAPPAAFLAYMAGTPKGVVLNEVGAECINGVHRVNWTRDGGSAYVLSTWSSLWALAVEQSARHYAGGVLKIEPGTAPGLPVVRHDDDAALDTLDALLRGQGREAAREFADELIVLSKLGFSRKQLDALRASADALAHRRAPRPLKR